MSETESSYVIVETTDEGYILCKYKETKQGIPIYLEIWYFHELGPALDEVNK